MTTIRLSREQHDGLRAIAAREHRSISGELRFIVERHLAESMEQEAA